ncbi:hypothetical protein Tco_0605870 [Tanacetum coccineum]
MGKTYKLELEAEEKVSTEVTSRRKRNTLKLKKQDCLQNLSTGERDILPNKEMMKEGYSFDEIKSLFEAIIKRVNTFTPMESDVDITVPKIAAGSSKRDAKEELGQESSKRQKIGESSQQAKD